MRAQKDSWRGLAISLHLTVAVGALGGGGRGGGGGGYCDVDLTICSPENFQNGGSDTNL